MTVLFHCGPFITALMTLAGLADTWLNLRRLPVDENGPGGTR